MSLKKDKKKVLGEVFNDEQVRSFLDLQAPEGLNPDFHCLERAYRGMVAENFETFVKFFVEAGRDINATDYNGRTLLAQMAEHQQAEEYRDALLAAGAR